MTSEEILKSFFGKTVKDLRVSMINVNEHFNEGVEDCSMPSTTKFLDLCVKFYPTLLKNYREDTAKVKGDANIIADRIFMPCWFSPSSSKKKQHPKDFEGDHESDKLCKEFGLYATHQIFAMLDNPTLCAALASKLKFDSLGIKSPELIVSEDGFTAKEVGYVIERGACNAVGVKTADACRYVAMYQCGNKAGVSLICGSPSFLSGSIDIFKSVFSHVDILKSIQKNKKRNGIDLEEVSIGFVAKEKTDQTKASSVAIARLLGGAIYTHDHLCVLKNIYGVKKLISIDKSSRTEMSKVDIDKVIEEYARIKKYYYSAKALNAIK